MSISSSALLVELNIGVWTAAIQDKTRTEEITHSNSAVRSAAKVTKHLMAGTSARKDIADYAAATRMWHNTKTLPWADRGSRLIPLSLFFDYKQEADVRKATFDGMVDKFIDEYPQHVEKAKANLGDLFDETDYPDAEEVRKKFSFKLVFSPMPESGDFRLDIPAQALEEIKQEYEASQNARLAEAMREPWDRLYKVLQNISAKLTDTNDDEKKRYHETLISNAQDLCTMLTHLNVTRDPELEKARRDLQSALLGVDIVEIRESADTRADVKKRIDEVLKAYSW